MHVLEVYNSIIASLKQSADHVGLVEREIVCMFYSASLLVLAPH